MEDKKKNLAIVSPIDGRVTTWDVKEALRNRPVTRGQEALQVADPSGEWELEVYLRDDRVGHMLRAQSEQPQEQLPVTFILKSYAGQTFDGTLEEMQDAATQDEQHGHAYRLKVKIDKNELQKRLRLAELTQGAEVKASVYCGRRSVAYCWFHELLEWVQVRLFAF